MNKLGVPIVRGKFAPIICGKCSERIERASHRVYPIVKRIGIWPISSGVPQHRKCP